MAKTVDFPNEIRDFGKALDMFSGRYYDYEVFQDFIDYVIACLLIDGCPETAENLKKKYDKEYPKFLELYRALLNCMHKNLGDDFEWYDVLGTAYEVVASRSKASSFGQFFTPKPICDLMAHISSPIQGENRTGLRVNDCACGSGRTLLAFNKIAPGNRIYGEDLDGICSKMAAINFALHGCKGQVCNMNSLDPSDWRFGFEINPHLYTLQGMPNLRRIRKEQSETWRQWESQRLRVAIERAQGGSQEVKPTPKVVTAPKVETPKETPQTDVHDMNVGNMPGTQLTLF